MMLENVFEIEIIVRFQLVKKSRALTAHPHLRQFVARTGDIFFHQCGQDTSEAAYQRYGMISLVI